MNERQELFSLSRVDIKVLMEDASIRHWDLFIALVEVFEPVLVDRLVILPTAEAINDVLHTGDYTWSRHLRVVGFDDH